MYAIRLRRFRLVLLVSLGTRRGSPRGRQPDGGQGSMRGAEALTVGDGETAEQPTRRHRPMGRLLVHGARDPGRRSGRAVLIGWLGGDR
jgi:hypothetical protein